MYISTGEAKKEQNELRKQITHRPIEGTVNTVAGADISYDKSSDNVYAGIIVLSYPDLSGVAQSSVITSVDFPYIPGLLAYRELPPLEEAWKQLKIKPDVLIMDGHGIAHPRRMGIATHFGIIADQPTIGCAKNLLTGNFDEPGIEKGDYSYIKENDKPIGIVLRSRTNVNPIFISPGHKVSFEDCKSIVMQCLTKYKLPETTRMAHDLVNKLRKGEAEPGYLEF